MLKYVKTEKTPKRDWMQASEIVALETLGTPEALGRAARLRRSDEALYRMGGYGRWIAKKDSEADQP